MNDELLALAEKSSDNDLAFLIKAKEEAKRRLKDDPSQENLRSFSLAREAVRAEISRMKKLVSSATFKTQTAACRFLDERGFKVSIQAFNKHFHEGRISRAEGGFEEGALLAYAAANLKAKAQLASEEAIRAKAGESSADQDLKRVMAERHKVKLLKETGQVILVADHEAELAARAQFFKGELSLFPRRVAPLALALTGGDETKLPEFVALLEKELEAAMDAWSQEREFVVSIPEDESGG